MDDPSPPRAIWLLALPLIPVQIGGFGAGVLVGVLTAPTDSLDATATILFDAAGGLTLTSVLATALLAQRAGWVRAIAIVLFATGLGLGGLALLGALGTALFFGLIVAVCGSH